MSSNIVAIVRYKKNVNFQKLVGGWCKYVSKDGAVTRLFYVLGEQGLLNDEICTAPADVLILPMTEDLSEAIALATDLRAAGVSTQIYTEKKKFKAKMNYADKLKVPYVYFLGEDEIAAGVVSCKDMRTGEQVKLPRAEAVQKAKDFVEADRCKPVICEK